MERERVACVVTRRNARVLNLQDEIEQLGAECRLFHLESYTQTHSYWSKKFMEVWGKRHGKMERYFERQKEEILREILAYHPTKILFINAVLSREQLQCFEKQTRIFFWFVDPVYQLPAEETACLQHYPAFVYDIKSRDYLVRQGIFVTYCPVGYNRSYHMPAESVQKIWDLCFVGSPYKERLHVLEPLAKAAEEHGWKFRVYGPFFERRYVWKRWVFQIRYPHLFRCLTNGTLTSEEIAAIYHRSKICLNLHGNGSEGVNPRTFEVLASGTMEIIDSRGDYDILRPEKDIAIFRDGKDLIQKIAWYLEHEEERQKMAAQGHARIWEIRSMKNCLKRIFETELPQEELCGN